jgi:hypothetical protein
MLWRESYNPYGGKRIGPAANRNIPNATPAQFESYLRSVYQRAEVLTRFPGGL